MTPVFYQTATTTEEAPPATTYESLQEVLEAKCSDDSVRAVLQDMLDVCAGITEALRTALVTVGDADSLNVSLWLCGDCC